MNKEEFTKVLEASLLLFDDVSEEEVSKLIGKEYLGCAKGIVGFVKGWKIK